ncbi:MAG: hypothetical protein WEA29_05315 [Acidimicrobiia bacterium]
MPGQKDPPRGRRPGPRPKPTGTTSARKPEPPDRVDRPTAAAPRRSWAAEGGLPRWVLEALTRATPKVRLSAAIEHLELAAKAFAASRYGKAMAEAESAKALSPRDATIRELIALSAYRLGRWDVALRELRVFRRLTGEPLHIPIEIDVLRALGRASTEIDEVWERLQRLDADPATRDEARVVYASHLMDRGETRRAWEITGPKRLTADPAESELRVWYVAARAAGILGDTATAHRLREAIEEADPAFPGLDELSRP